jgi:hypothetical protein
MKSTVLWGLIVLNAVLLGMFVFQGNRANSARADIARADDYILIPGEVSVAPAEVVYVLDVTTGKLGAISYDDINHNLQTMPPINLVSMLKAASAPGAAPPAPGNGMVGR